KRGAIHVPLEPIKLRELPEHARLFWFGLQQLFQLEHLRVLRGGKLQAIGATDFAKQALDLFAARLETNSVVSPKGCGLLGRWTFLESSLRSSKPPESLMVSQLMSPASWVGDAFGQ